MMAIPLLVCVAMSSLSLCVADQMKYLIMALKHELKKKNNKRLQIEKANMFSFAFTSMFKHVLHTSDQEFRGNRYIMLQCSHGYDSTSHLHSDSDEIFTTI